MSDLGQEDKWVEKEWTLGERFGANVAWFRREAGLSQEALGERVGMDRVQISELERGRLPRLDTILRLVAGLEVKNCDLVAWMWWDPGRHEHYESPADASSGYEVLDFDLPAGFRVSPVGYESEERFKYRLGQRMEDQLGAEPHRLAGHLLARRQHVGDLPQLRAFVVAQRRAQQPARAVGDFEQVDETALAVVGQPHAQRLGSAVEPAAQAAIGSRQLGGEAQHRLRLGVELVGRDHRDRGTRGQRAARGEEALWSQCEGDSDGAEDEGRERGRGGEEVIEADARHGAPEGGDHEHREDRQHRPGIATVALHALASG
ncbi:MAG: helix-turn-helix domain-containing protein [Solirubrobacterales bacterium]